MSEQSQNETKEEAMSDAASPNPLGLSDDSQRVLSAALNYSLSGEGLDMSIGAGYAVCGLFTAVFLFIGLGGSIFFGLVHGQPEGFFCLLALLLLVFPYAIFNMTRNLDRARKG